MKKLLLFFYLFLGITCSSLNAQWSELGAETGGLNANGLIESVVTDATGNVYAAGLFTDTAGKFYVAKWDKNTNTWSEIGAQGFQYGIRCIAVDNNTGNVYAAGNFYDSFYCAIYVWNKNNNAWSELGAQNRLTQLVTYVYSITIDQTNGNVFAAGSNGGVAMWDKSKNMWVDLGDFKIFCCRINSLVTDNIGNVYAGGNVYDTSTGYRTVFKFNKSLNGWSILGNPLQLNNLNQINGIAIDNNNGYVYATIGSVISKYDGYNWSILDSSDVNAPSGSSCLSVDKFGNVYAYVGSNSSNLIKKFDGINWNSLNIHNIVANLSPYAYPPYSNHNICTDSFGNIYVGYDITNKSGKYFVAKYVPCNPTASTTTIGSCGSFVWNGTTYSKSGTYIAYLNNSAGCDSVATLNLTIYPVTPITQTLTVYGCNNIIYRGINYIFSTTKRDTLKNSFGCDSVYIVATIRVNKITPTTQTTTVKGCNNVVYNGVSYSTSTVHTDTVKSYQGCDSIYKVANIIVNQVTPIIQNIAVNGCNSVLYNGVTYSTSTVHTDTVKSSQGCDSIYKVATITVVPNNLAISITGISNGGNICIGSKDTLGGVPTGGVWSSSNTNLATINSSNGIVMGFSTGTVSFYYTVSNNTGCTSMNVIAGGTALPSITGVNNVCLGKTTTFSNTTKGGKWYSSNTAIAQIDSSTGIISGNTLGVAKILYVVASGVCPKTASRDVSVSYTSPVTSYISLSGCNSLVYNGVTGLV